MTIKRICLTLSLIAFAATSVYAAEGKIKSVTDDKVVVELSAPGNLKKGSSVKVNSKAGKITAVEGNLFSVKLKKAAGFKAGDAVKVDKVNEMQGC